MIYPLEIRKDNLYAILEGKRWWIKMGFVAIHNRKRKNGRGAAKGFFLD